MNKTIVRFGVGCSLTFVICIVLTLVLNYLGKLYGYTTPVVLPGTIAGIIVVLLMPVLERRCYKK